MRYKNVKIRIDELGMFEVDWKDMIGRKKYFRTQVRALRFIDSVR